MVTAITALVKHGTALDKIMAVQYSSDSEQQKLDAKPSSSEPNNNGTQSAVMHQANGTQIGMPSMIRNQSGGQILPTGGSNPNSSMLETVIYTSLPVYPYPMVPRFTGMGNVNVGINYAQVPSITTTTTSQDDLDGFGKTYSP